MLKLLKPTLKTAPILLAFLTYLTLTACGTKGPLYIPEQRYPQGVSKGASEANTDASYKISP